MRVTRRQLRRIIKEQLDQGLAGGSAAEFDNEYVTFPEGGFKGQDELAAEVAPRAEWDDDFDKMGMYAAMALAKNYGVTTVTDAEQPGKSWNIGEFITHLQKIASEAW